MAPQAGRYLMYVGTYTLRESKGVYLQRFDAATGALEALGLVAEMPNPSFLALHPERKFLYAVSEVRDSKGRHGGAVYAFAIDATKDGRLTLLNERSSQGVGPCHLSVDRTGRCVLVANYESGTAAVLPIREDGSVGEATDVVRHQGSSADLKRQAGPHAHSITPSPGNRFALVADLGLDRIMVYRLDAAAGRLLPNDPPWGATRPGAGPRHMAFHPRLPFVYVIDELDNTMTVFGWDESRGSLRETQVLSTLPADFRGATSCADVHVASSGRFLYGSNRGHDSIAVFRMDESSGALSAIGHQPTMGKSPRNFAIDPSGLWLLAANQDSDSIVVFRTAPETGLPTPTGRAAKVSMPVCLRFVPEGR